MRSLRRRIEALETISGVLHDRQQAIAKRALNWMGPSAESLLAAYGADRVGRPHRKHEAAARQAYAEVLEREFRGTGVPPIMDTEVDLSVVMAKCLLTVLFSPLTDQQLELFPTGSQAVRRGQTPTEAESVVLEAYNSQMERISLMMGFDSVEEFWRFLEESGVRQMIDDEAM